MNKKKTDDISDLRDESNRDSIRIAIELKSNTVPDIVLVCHTLMNSLNTNIVHIKFKH